MNTIYIRRRLLLWLVAAIVLSMLATSCRSMRKPSTNEPREGNEQPAATLPEPQKPKRELSVMNFTATIDGMNVNGQVRMAADSVMWVSVSKFIELGRAKATVDSVWINVPLMNRQFAGTYDEVSRRAGRTVTFEWLQHIATAPDAEKQAAALARQLGIDAEIKITRRQSVETLTFPY